MEKKYIIGNWKSNKTVYDVKTWFDLIKEKFIRSPAIKTNSIEIVVCPPYVHIPPATKLRDEYKLPLKIGAQDTSPFGSGAYTGAVSAQMLKEYVEYVIVGHSERRTNFHEDDTMLFEKVKRVKEANLKAIFCIQSEQTPIPADVSIVAYEPTWAIGSGTPDSPDNANKIGSMVKHKLGTCVFIYGGSVTPLNVKDFLSKECIDGVLPGKASLDPQTFWEIITNAAIN